MGKHSNIILYNKKTNLILGCAHNISQEKSSVRELWGGIEYSYPPPQNKIDILNDSFGGFASLIYGLDEPELIASTISKKYQRQGNLPCLYFLQNFEKSVDKYLIRGIIVFSSQRLRVLKFKY
jgi:hypothetical protein